MLYIFVAGISNSYGVCLPLHCESVESIPIRICWIIPVQDYTRLVSIDLYLFGG